MELRAKKGLDAPLSAKWHRQRGHRLALLGSIKRHLPAGVTQFLSRVLMPSGIPYCLNYIAIYSDAHRSENFAGNLAAIVEQYVGASSSTREILDERVESIAASLVLANGVRKTTYRERHAAALKRIFDDEQVRVQKSRIRVLDIPSSFGTTSWDSHQALSEHYQIAKYVLADRYWKVLLNPTTECIYDEDGCLLQVRGKKRFFSVNRPQTKGEGHGIVAKMLFAPLDARSWYLRKKHRLASPKCLVEIPLVHPEIVDRVANGTLTLARYDIFGKIDEEFDIILSFNLLQRNYFTDREIELGRANLASSLAEQGILVTGNTDAYSVFKKVGGELCLVKSEGRF